MEPEEEIETEAGEQGIEEDCQDERVEEFVFKIEREEGLELGESIENNFLDVSFEEERQQNALEGEGA